MRYFSKGTLGPHSDLGKEQAVAMAWEMKMEVILLGGNYSFSGFLRYPHCLLLIPVAQGVNWESGEGSLHKAGKETLTLKNGKC